jgi:hypothetical protein
MVELHVEDVRTAIREAEAVAEVETALFLLWHRAQSLVRRPRLGNAGGTAGTAGRCSGRERHESVTVISIETSYIVMAWRPNLPYRAEREP